MINKLLKSEIPIVSKLYASEMKPHFISIGEEPFSIEKYNEILTNNIEKSEMYVLRTHKIEGFIWFYKERDEFFLEEIFVIEKRKNNGKKLINFLLNEAKKQNILKINLDVHFNNKSAQAFFRTFGFTQRSIEMSLDL